MTWSASPASLAKRSEMKKFQSGDVVLQDTAHDGLGNFTANHLGRPQGSHERLARKSCAIVTSTATETTLGATRRRPQLHNHSGATHPTGCVAPIKIIPFSLVDGPGSRTAVFLQGCNIRCAYCHNPETQVECISCQACVKPCPAHALSVADGKVVGTTPFASTATTSIKVCQHKSTPKIELLSAREVADRCISNMPFIRGITTSGGECMLRPDFLYELFTYCNAAGLNCLIDSNGTIDFTEYRDLLDPLKRRHA